MNPPDPGIKPGSPALQEDSFSTELLGKQLLIISYITKTMNFCIVQVILLGVFFFLQLKATFRAVDIRVERIKTWGDLGECCFRPRIGWYLN